MRALLDTHAFLWWMLDAPPLTTKARLVIEDPESILFLSAVSAWEIAIKARAGKLTFAQSPEIFIPEMMNKQQILPLPIEFRHALRVGKLPDHHRDPFDRLLIAQAQQEGLAIITVDPQIAKYAVEVIW